MCAPGGCMRKIKVASAEIWMWWESAMDAMSVAFLLEALRLARRSAELAMVMKSLGQPWAIDHWCWQQHIQREARGWRGFGKGLSFFLGQIEEALQYSVLVCTANRSKLPFCGSVGINVAAVETDAIFWDNISRCPLKIWFACQMLMSGLDFLESDPRFRSLRKIRTIWWHASRLDRCRLVPYVW